jgi:hypothetical protein
MKGIIKAVFILWPVSMVADTYYELTCSFPCKISNYCLRQTKYNSAYNKALHGAWIETLF